MTVKSDIFFPKDEFEKMFIRSIWWFAEYDLSLRKETILPKGTVEIIFNFSDEIIYNNSSFNVSKKLPPVFINGLNFKPFELTKSGRQDFLGIQCTPIGLKLLSIIPIYTFNDSVVEGKFVCSDIETLTHNLFNAQTFDEKVKLILDWIKKKLIGTISDYSLNRAIKIQNIKSINEKSVKKVSDEICLSERQLRRFTYEWFGMNTEELILYNKYLCSLRFLHNTNSPLSKIGFEAGYYDQSHFIREFKRYTFITPGEYQKALKGIPGHIYA